MYSIKLLLLVLSVSTLSAKSVSSIYTHKCASCHGKKAEYLALGKAKALNTMTVAQIVKEIKAIASGERKTLPMIKKTKTDFIKSHDIKNIYDMAVYIEAL